MRLSKKNFSDVICWDSFLTISWTLGADEETKIGYFVKKKPLSSVKKTQMLLTKNDAEDCHIFHILLILSEMIQGQKLS